jgi:DNA-binding NarL/FixJ family response regulator
MKKIKVLIADNGEIFRQGLALLFKHVPGIEVVGTCSSGAETIQKAVELKPEIVILDKYIMDPEFIEVCRNIRELPYKTRLIISQPFRDAEYISALKAEADAYIDKDIPIDIFSRILEQVNMGQAFLSPAIAALVLKESSHSQEPSKWEYYEREIALTHRESQILSMMAHQGMSNKEIANTLFISEGTVKVHLTRIFEKMRVRGRHKAIALAREKGIIHLGATVNS